MTESESDPRGAWTVSILSSDLFFGGRRIPSQRVGLLCDSSAFVGDESQLPRRLAEDGYVFLRNVLDKEGVLAAREEVFARLVEMDEIKQPAIAGIGTGHSRRRELVQDLIAFWRSVSEGPALRRVTHGPDVQRIVDLVLGATARPQDYLWLRPRPVGWTTELHFDRPFFASEGRRVVTVWIALGDIPVSDGPLTLIEGSHRFQDLVDMLTVEDDNISKSPETELQAAFDREWSQDAISLVRQRGTRFLSEDFLAGDLVVFGMDTLHAALDNRSTIGRVRLSCDVRYQLASDPIDHRYFGPNPSGQQGTGYGDMNSAQPLSSPASDI